MTKEISITQEELEQEIRSAFKHGQGNARAMECGLERDEVEDYTSSVMLRLIKLKQK